MNPCQLGLPVPPSSPMDVLEMGSQYCVGRSRLEVGILSSLSHLLPTGDTRTSSVHLQDGQKKGHREVQVNQLSRQTPLSEEERLNRKESDPRPVASEQVYSVRQVQNDDCSSCKDPSSPWGPSPAI